MSTVAVIIPVLNDAPMLEHALVALAAQTRPPYEVIVVDNGCTDDSVAVAHRFGARVVDEPIRGILAATARGFDAASADILARIDADSRPEPGWLARVASDLDGDPRLAAVTGTGIFYGGGALARTLGRHLYLGGYFLWLGLLLGRPPLYGSNCAIRREVWGRVRPRVRRFDARVHDDLEISFHLPPESRVRFDPELAMPVSARPFATASQTARRVGWGFRTIWVNARAQNLGAKRRAVVAARRGDARQNE